MILVLSSLNKLDATTKGIKQFSNPQALSSTLAALKTLQHHSFGLLNHLVLLVLASNYYKAVELKVLCCELNMVPVRNRICVAILVQQIEELELASHA